LPACELYRLVATLDAAVGRPGELCQNGRRYVLPCRDLEFSLLRCGNGLPGNRHIVPAGAVAKPESLWDHDLPHDLLFALGGQRYRGGDSVDKYPASRLWFD